MNVINYGQSTTAKRLGGEQLATKAYILIDTQVGQSREIMTALRSMNGVVSAEIVTGNYDVIALVEADDMGTMADLVTGMVQGVSGVMRTITCICSG